MNHKASEGREKVEVGELPIIRQGKQAGEGERFVSAPVVIPPSRCAKARVSLHPVESSNTVRLGPFAAETLENPLDSAENDGTAKKRTSRRSENRIRPPPVSCPRVP